jgi:hypothetical protein
MGNKNVRVMFKFNFTFKKHKIATEFNYAPETWPFIADYKSNKKGHTIFSNSNVLRLFTKTKKKHLMNNGNNK